jgi:hypothetical protein
MSRDVTAWLLVLTIHRSASAPIEGTAGRSALSECASQGLICFHDANEC